RPAPCPPAEAAERGPAGGADAAAAGRVRRRFRRNRGRGRAGDGMSDLALDAERVSYVVHELRSPLAVVSGYTSFLLDEGAGELGDEQREILDRVRRSAKMLERLLSDVAEFA